MKKYLIVLTLIIGLLMVSGEAMALATFGDGGDALQGVFNDITIAPIPGVSSVDVVTDNLPDWLDAYWEITAAGSSVAAMVVELASFAPNNILRIYDPANPANTVDLFVGASVPGDKATLTIDLAGNVTVTDPVGGGIIDTGLFPSRTFGYQLDSTFYGDGGLWYSDTSLNSDDMDHMYAYLGKKDTVQYPPPPDVPIWAGEWSDNEYAFAFEDLDKNAPSDRDYTDMVVLVESVIPVSVPEPGTLLLLLGLVVGVAGFGCKKFKF